MDLECSVNSLITANSPNLSQSLLADLHLLDLFSLFEFFFPKLCDSSFPGGEKDGKCCLQNAALSAGECGHGTILCAVALFAN